VRAALDEADDTGLAPARTLAALVERAADVGLVNLNGVPALAEDPMSWAIALRMRWPRYHAVR
jgi:hypothetical protein